MLEACRNHNPAVKVVFAGTRQVYGRPDSLPVDETPSRPADRRQRHQQGRRRVLPPRLQQRLRRPRLLAAADERLRPAPADQTQPPGLHRLVHPARHREPARSRSTATARSSATSSTSTMRPTRSCGPAPATRATARCSTSAATQPISHRDLTALLVEVAGIGPRRVRRVAGGEEGDRHRQLLRRLVASSARDRLDAGGVAARRTRAHRSRSTASTSTSYVDEPGRAPEPSVMSAVRIPFLSLRPGEDARRGPRRDRPRHRARLVRARARGRGVRARSSPPRPARRTPSASATAPTRSR